MFHFQYLFEKIIRIFLFRITMNYKFNLQSLQGHSEF